MNLDKCTIIYKRPKAAFTRNLKYIYIRFSDEQNGLSIFQTNVALSLQRIICVVSFFVFGEGERGLTVNFPITCDFNCKKTYLFSTDSETLKTFVFTKRTVGCLSCVMLAKRVSKQNQVINARFKEKEAYHVQTSKVIIWDFAKSGIYVYKSMNIDIVFIFVLSVRMCWCENGEVVFNTESFQGMAIVFTYFMVFTHFAVLLLIILSTQLYIRYLFRILQDLSTKFVKKYPYLKNNVLKTIYRQILK